MTIGCSDSIIPAPQKVEHFRVEAAEVLSSLRKRVAVVLSDLGGFNRPADLQHSLSLDKTLGRQIFKLAWTAEALAVGSVVPSRTSIGRFLDSARERGITTEKLENVWAAYEAFEKLVQTHSGDRATFNSMVAGSSGVDDEWHAIDLQHRRNAFRALSHTMGMQIKTYLRLIVVSLAGDGNLQAALISGCIGLRVLRPTSSFGVHGVALSPIAGNPTPTWEPLGLSESPNEDLLEAFCSKPLPTLKVTHGDSELGPWRRIAITDPQVGNLGTTTLIFGSVCPKVPIGNDPLQMHVSFSKPSEGALFDVVIDPRIAGGRAPVGQAMLGYNVKYGGEITPLQGKFIPELLGHGPAALSTPEVPHYAEMLGAVGRKLGLDLSEFNAWRLRVEFPLYQSTLCMSWK